MADIALDPEKKDEELENLLGVLAKTKKDKDILREEVKKRGENIDKLVSFHNKTVEDLKVKHAEELSKIKTALKSALMDDHE